MRGDRHVIPMAWRSVGLAKNGGKGNGKQIVTEFVGDVQHPFPPGVCRLCRDQRAHHACGMIACLGKIDHRSAAPVDQDLVGIGAMEINLWHLPSPVRKSKTLRLVTTETRSGSSGAPGKANYGRRGTV